MNIRMLNTCVAVVNTFLDEMPIKGIGKDICVSSELITNTERSIFCVDRSQIYVYYYV